MFTRTILFTVLAACGVPSQQATNPAEPLGGDSVEHVKAAVEEPPTEEPDKLPPGADIQEDQHFCCQSVDPKAMTGEGCNAISGSLEVINSCTNVLFCPAGWAKDNGNVYCE
jgi:hypothetical protein